MAVGTLVFEKSSYENVLCLGHILAEDGRKMSKHLGNILEPIPLMDRHGADAVRWFMLAGGSPWSARRVGHETLSEVVRKVLLTYWNTASFFTLYAETNGWDPATAPAPARADRPLLDRWALAELASVTAGVTDALEDFDTQTAGRLLAEFVDDLSNWYVRRSRRRFWDGDPAALGTLHEVLDGLTRLMAPFTPFVTEEVWSRAVVPGLAGRETARPPTRCTWPRGPRSTRRRGTTTWSRRWTWSGASSSWAGRPAPRPRCAPGSRSRGPPSPPPGGRALPRDLVAEVADELNVAELIELAGVGELVDVSLKIDFRAVGRRLGKQVQAVAQAVAAADPAELTAAYRAGTASVEVDGAAVPLLEGDLIVTETPREGWTVASGGGLTVALDLTLTPELERAGLVREVVRLLQEARKNSGLEVSDRIELWWTAEGPLAQALERARGAGGRRGAGRLGPRRHAGHRGRRRGARGLAVLGGPRRQLRPRRSSAAGGLAGALPVGEVPVGGAQRARGEPVGARLVQRQREGLPAGEEAAALQVVAGVLVDDQDLVGEVDDEEQVGDLDLLDPRLLHAARPAVRHVGRGVGAAPLRGEGSGRGRARRLRSGVRSRAGRSTSRPQPVPVPVRRRARSPGSRTSAPR